MSRSKSNNSDSERTSVPDRRSVYAELLAQADLGAQVAESKWEQRARRIDALDEPLDSVDVRGALESARHQALVWCAPRSRLGALEAERRINAVHDATIQLLDWAGPHPAYPGTSSRHYRDWRIARQEFEDMMAMDASELSTEGVEQAVRPAPVADHRKRGAPRRSSPTGDRQIAERWKASGERTYAAFALKHGVAANKVRAAVDRDRKRRSSAESPPE
jgi:hypothetical protein